MDGTICERIDRWRKRFVCVIAGGPGWNKAVLLTCARPLPGAAPCSARVMTGRQRCARGALLGSGPGEDMYEHEKAYCRTLGFNY